MNESETQSTESQAKPDHVTIGENTYSIDQITAAIEAQTTLSSKAEMIEMAEYIAETLKQGPEGASQLITQLKQLYPDPTPEAPIELSDLASDNELKLHSEVTKLRAANKALEQKLTTLAEQFKSYSAELANVARIETTATTSVQKVQAELGLTLTPAEIREAIKATGIKDPVDAVLLHRKADVLKAKPKAEKPNFVEDTGSTNIDLEKLPLAEQLKLTLANPSLLKNYTPKKTVI